MRRKNETINVSKLIFVVLVLSFFAIVAKVLLVSLAKETNGINLTEFKNNRNTEKQILPAVRGSIYSVDGEVLAHTVNSYTVIAYLSPTRTKNQDKPQHVVNKEKTAEELSLILNMSKEYILSLLSQDLYQVELGPNGRGITELTKKTIEALDLPGIGFIETSKRYYDKGRFASYTIGYAQADASGLMSGKMGIEQYFDEDLQGEDGYTIYQKDAYGYTIPNTNPISVEADNGKDIYLTIDSHIQLFLENAIQELSTKGDMSFLTFSVIDAKTGAVVASSSNPNFNLNKLDIESWQNPLVSYAYEPGSTMKIFSFLAAMENGIYEGSKTYNSGTIKVDDFIIKDFNNVGWGTITYDKGFAYSSNVAATNLALALGREKLYNFYKDLGFGKKTGLELPDEMSGDIDFTYKSEIATASFGQGITTTPIQNLQALTILANDGVMLEPYIVDKIVDSTTGEVTYKHERKELGQKISAEHAKKVLDLMYDVVYCGMTDAKFFKTESVKMVGKTGTAQIAGPNGKYLTGTYDYIRSFAGVFPYESPQYIIYVSAKQFNGNFRDVANMAVKVVEEIAKYKNITELIEKVDNNKIVTMDNFISLEVNSVEEKLKNLNLNVIKLGNGKYIINQYPENKQIILSGNKVFLLTNDSNIVMPDIMGWSSSDVITLCKMIGVNYNITGYGSVIATNIEAGTVIDKNVKIEISLG